MQPLIKTFLVPESTDPQTLIEEDLTRRGISYEVSDILCQELPGDVERKTVSQTMDSETDILPSRSGNLPNGRNGGERRSGRQK